MDELDSKLAEAARQIEEAELPLRMRGGAEPADGYDNYLTEAEALVRTPLVTAYRWKKEQLEALKAEMEGNDDERS